MANEYAYPNDLIFYVKYHIKEGFETEFKERLQHVIKNMRKEENFVSAFVHQYEDDKSRFSMYERWRISSKDDFMTYQMEAKEYRKEYERRLPIISKKPRKIHLLRPIAGWMSSSLQPTPNDLVFYVNFHIKADKVEEWKSKAFALVEKMAHEDTFICTFLHQDEEDPSRFTIYERWNEPDFETLAKSKNYAEEYRKVYKDLLPDLTQSIRNFRVLNSINNYHKENMSKPLV